MSLARRPDASGRHLALALALGAALCLRVQGQELEEMPPLPSIAYEVVIDGPLDEALQTLLEDVSEARRLTVRPPSSLLQLRRRAADDRPRLVQALRSEGYYAAEVEPHLDTGSIPARITFTALPGEPYRFETLLVEAIDPPPGFVAPEAFELGLVPGRRAESDRVLAAEVELLLHARRAGHPFAELGPRRAVVDHRTLTMDLTLRIVPGPQARMGGVSFQGVDSIAEDFLQRRIPWRRGDPYRPELIEEARRSLLATNLFSTVRMRRAEALDEDGRLEVAIEVAERAHRSIGVGLRYLTDEGPGADVTWEHRNLFRRGERLQASIDGSGIGYEIKGNFRKPDFRIRRMDLIADGGIAYQDTDAYLRRSAGAGIGLERTLRPGMTATAGVAYRAVRLTDQEGTEEFALLSLPLTFDWDRSDSLLDPTRGGRLDLQVVPFADTLGSGVMFGRLLGRYSHYFQVSERPRVILAARAALGGMVGAGRAAIPADERFYAGGGGSVRGIAFQLASPLGTGGRPRGGRSLLETALEARVRLTETIGFAAFVDAGRAFESSFPDLSERVQIGAGLGLRYHTAIGPIRLDLAVPVERRRVDDRFQVYVSIGQAF
jgi:translocation and assembly module TamA